MNVSRHIAKDMRSALGMVREIYGPDAVILSNRKVPEGIEITATADYDESSMAPAKAEPVKYSFPSIDEEKPVSEPTRKASPAAAPAQSQELIANKAQPSAIKTMTDEEAIKEQLQRRQKAAESLAASLRKRATSEQDTRAAAARTATSRTIEKHEFQQASEPVESESEFTVELSRAARDLSGTKDIPGSRLTKLSQEREVQEDEFFDSSMESLLNPAISMDDLPEPLDHSIAHEVEQITSDIRSGFVGQSNQADQVNKGRASRQATTQEQQNPEVLWTNDSMLNDMRKELLSLRSLVETQISGFAWGDINRRSPVKAGIMRQLVALGLNSAMAKRLSDHIPEDLGHRKAWFRALAMFANQVPIAGDTILTQGGTVALVGPAGVGKTTIVAKLAVQYALRHGRENVALITTDASRFGAFDQIRNLASILKMPVRAAGSGPELEAALDSFSDRQLVLIDTAGLSHRDERLLKTLETIKGSSAQLKAYMVMSASTQSESLDQMINAFKPINPCGCIISKVDESSSLGPILSAAAEHKLPISYYSEGQKIPDDLKIAEVQELVGKAVAISKSMNAFEKTEDVMMEQILMGETR